MNHALNHAAPHAIVSAIEGRVSANLYDAGQPLAPSQISELVRLATLAPSAFNLQNWRFIAVTSDATKARLQAIAANQPKVGQAAVTFIVIGQLADAEQVPARLQPSVDAGYMTPELVSGWTQGAHGLYTGQPQTQRDEAVRSATLAAATLMFAAEAHGLVSGPMIGFDAGALAAEFALAGNEVPVMLVTVGHAAPGNWPQKPRRPVADLLSFA